MLARDLDVDVVIVEDGEREKIVSIRESGGYMQIHTDRTLTFHEVPYLFRHDENVETEEEYNERVWEAHYMDNPPWPTITVDND